MEPLGSGGCGPTHGSLDPLALRRARGVSRDDVALQFAAPEIRPGEGWTGWIVLPARIDYSGVTEARVDVAGRKHLQFEAPGSGSLVEE